MKLCLLAAWLQPLAQEKIINYGLHAFERSENFVQHSILNFAFR